MAVAEKRMGGPFQGRKFYKSRPEFYADDLEFKMSLYRILLVEDDFDDQFLTRKKLIESKYVGDVSCFSNGRDLIEFLHKQLKLHDNYLSLTPVIIILDLDMPLLNGFEALHEIKVDPLLEKIPVIVLSGTDSKMAIEKALSLGALSVFRKPLNLHHFNVFLKRTGISFWRSWLWAKISRYFYRF
jgi:CheY-like chemotaxis protein